MAIVETTNADDVDALVKRLFTMLGVPVPREGNVVFVFHEALLTKVRPEPVITIKRAKSVEHADRQPHTGAYASSTLRRSP